MSQNEKVNNLKHRIQSVKRLENNYLLTQSILKISSSFIVFFLIVSFIELFANGNVFFRTCLFFTAIGLSLISSIILTKESFNRVFGSQKESLDMLASRIGSQFEGVMDKITNAIQLSSIEYAGMSPSLTTAAIERVYEETQSLDFTRIINKEDNKKRILILFSISLILLLFIFMPKNVNSAFSRVVNYNKSFIPPAPFELTIDPIQKNVLREENISIKVLVHGKAPDKINLYIKEPQQDKYDVYSLRLDSGNTYKFDLLSIKNSIVFFAEADWLSTKIKTVEGKITVSDRPLIKSMKGTVNFPAYTKTSTKNIDESNADISAIIGSNVAINVYSNKELDSAFVVFEDRQVAIQDSSNLDQLSNKKTTKIRMKSDANSAKAEFKVNRTCNYYFELWDKFGNVSQNPIKYNIIAEKDEFPSISLITPTNDVQLTENAKLAIKVNISDDFGFKNLSIFYKLIESKYTSAEKNYSSLNIPLVSNENSQEVPFLWDVQKLGISPEDKYEFYLEVTDNDIISGPKKSKTQIITFRLPSLDEVIKKADQAQNQIDNNLEKIFKEVKELKKDIENLKQDLNKSQKDPKLKWDQAKKAENIEKKQEELKQKFEDVTKQLQKTTDQMQENKLLKPETMQKYMELQKLMSQINNPEFKQMQKQMNEALEKMQPQDMQKALEKMKINDEEFLKSIERTMKMLEKLKAEQKADALMKKADELAKNQNEVNKDMQSTNPKDQEKKDALSKAQENLKKDLNSLNKDLKDFEEQMKKMGQDAPKAEMDEAKQNLDMQKTEQDMDQAQKDIEKNDFADASEKQKDAEKNLKNFSNSMNKMKQQMKNNQNKENIRKMEKSINDMIQLSKEQEQILNQTRNSDFNSTKLPDINKKQGQNQDALENLANQMSKLAENAYEVSPEMGKEIGQAMANMEKAQQELAERRTNTAAQAQAQAMSNLNQAAGQMESALGKMKGKGKGKGKGQPGGDGQGDGEGGSSPGSSFSQKLQEAAAMQQMINQSLQQMMGQKQGKEGGKDGQGQGQGMGNMSDEQKAEYGRVQGKQGQAKKAIDELTKEQEKFGNADQKKAVTDLNKIADEMKEVMSEMQSGNISPETLKRQEKILSRLLDANRSVNDRDYEKQREAKSGKDYTRRPQDIDLNSLDGKNQALQELIKSLQLGYTKDYEALIRKYFEALKTKKVTN